MLQRSGWRELVSAPEWRFEAALSRIERRGDHADGLDFHSSASCAHTFDAHQVIHAAAVRRASTSEARRLVRQDEIGDHAVVVTRPDSVDRPVEDSLAVHHLQGRTVQTAASQDVVDLPCHRGRHLPVADQRVRQLERVSRVAGMGVLPRVL